MNTTSRLQAIIDTSIEGIITIDNAGIILSFNPAAEKLFAYHADEVIGENISMLMPSPHQEQHDNYIKNYLTTGEAKIIGKVRELTATRKDGRVLYIWLTVAEFTENDQHFFVGFIQDITQSKKYLEKVSSYENILEDSLNEIYIFDAETLYFIRVNKGALDNLLYSSEEIQKLTPVDIKPEFSLENFQQLIQPLRTGEENKITFITIHERKDGSTYPVEVHLELISYESRPVFVAIILDITKRLETEEKLRLSEEEFQLIFENAPTGLAVIDLDGKYLDVNPALCDIVGYSKPELLNLNYIDITHPDDIEVSKKFLSRMLRGELSGYNIEKRYIRKDRRIVNVILNVSSVDESVTLAHDKKGKPLLLIAHILDITEEIQLREALKKQQEQLVHMDRVGMMGEMAAGIAHEINQPLTAIDSYTKAAQRRMKAENLDFEKLEELLDKISSASLRAGDVITRMRAMVKRETKKHVHININTSIEEAVNLVQADTQAIHFEITLDLADNLPSVAADVVQIQQVILNLIRNGMEATAEENKEINKIIVSSTFLASENRVQVSVKDFGIGIDDEEAKYIFDPFYTTKSSGMGMGLAISQSIIQQHGGNLWLEKNADKGTTFYFTIPTILD